MNKKFKNYLILYLSFLYFICIFFLYTKHSVGNDSTISEWLINYSGGFTKRGIIGEISIFFSRSLRSILKVYLSTSTKTGFKPL